MSSTSPEQIEQDIEATRQDLREDVEALKDKLSPTSAAQRGAARISETVSDARDRVMGTTEDTMDSVKGSASAVADRAQSQMRGNPLAVGLAAFAIGWLIGSLLPASEREKEAAAALRESDTVRNAVEPLQESARTIASQAADQAKGAAQRVSEEAKTAAQNVREEAKDQAETVREEVKGQAETIRGGNGASAADDATYPPDTTGQFSTRGLGTFGADPANPDGDPLPGAGRVGI